LKHFLLEPLAFLAKDTPQELLAAPKHKKLLEIIRSQLSRGNKQVTSSPDFMRRIDEARSAFALKMKKLRLGLSVVACVQQEVGKRGHLPLNLDPDKGGMSTCELISDILRDQAGPDIKVLGNSIT
jgi:hypothetical protein